MALTPSHCNLLSWLLQTGQVLIYYHQQNGPVFGPPEVMFLVHPDFLGLGGGYLSGWTEVEDFLETVEGELPVFGG